MTLKIRVTSQFKKDLKKAARDPHKNTQLLKSIIDDYLIQSKTVPEHHKPHLLAGNWKPCWECHVQPDFLLIWDIDLAANELILLRYGSHAELFG